ncbi:MAG TPA: DNA-binding domain-containing protein [Steroidobacteraceae bacterium]|nr:DNA-binding domain-containing protein [Steroidobacteraceae bacterium]
MRPLSEVQGEFALALLDPERRAPPECVDPAGRPDARRFAVYRNNVASSLIEALEAAYPAVRRLVGEDYFRAVARIYVADAPPRSPIMLHYGEGFAEFLARYEPLADYPYLRDVARIERAWLEAYHAAEAEPLNPDVLAGIAAHRVADLCFTLHPSVRLVRSAFPALTIWRANVRDEAPLPIGLEAAAEDALIARPEAEVEVRLMPPGGARFLEALAQGWPLAEAAAACACESFDLTAHLTALLESGLLTAARLR